MKITHNSNNNIFITHMPVTHTQHHTALSIYWLSFTLGLSQQLHAEVVPCLFLCGCVVLCVVCVHGIIDDGRISRHMD